MRALQAGTARSARSTRARRCARATSAPRLVERRTGRWWRSPDETFARWAGAVDRHRVAGDERGGARAQPDHSLRRFLGLTHATNGRLGDHLSRPLRIAPACGCHWRLDVTGPARRSRRAPAGARLCIATGSFISRPRTKARDHLDPYARSSTIASRASLHRARIRLRDPVNVAHGLRSGVDTASPPTAARDATPARGSAPRSSDSWQPPLRVEERGRPLRSGPLP